MLEYDNSAFYYFGISMCLVYLIPSYYYSGKRILFGCFLTDHLLDQHDVRCEKELQKIRKLQAEKTKMRNIFTLPFLMNLLMTCILTYSLVIMVDLVQNDSQIKSFDPYAILNIDYGASDKEIKKAYRKQSLLYHPDKNQGDSIAEGKFMMIAKAYEALTDEVAKENYEKYGNPDGRQALQMSIGLPTFLLEGKNHGVIMFVYLLVLVIIIPTVVALWYSNSKKYGDSMIMYDTYGFFNYALSEHAHLKMFPEILAGSAEFRDIPSRESDSKELSKLMKHFKQHSLVQKFRYNHPIIVKSNLLLHAHLYREQLSPALRNDLNLMLKQSMHLLDGMLEISTMKYWLQTTINVVEFMQYMTQALWVKDSSLMQLPNFTETEVKHCMSGKGGLRSIDQFIRAAPSDRKGMNNFTDEEREEVNRVCGIMPNVEWDLSIGVDDEEEIAEGDIMTLTIKLTRKNVPEGETCDLVYAPEFPFPKAERWIVLVSNGGDQLQASTKITKQDRVVTEKLLFPAPQRKGSYALEVFLKSDSFMGMDQMQVVKFNVISSADLPVYEMHPEDKELDNEPTLFEQMAGANYDSSDSEAEEEKDDEDASSEDSDQSDTDATIKKNQ